MDAAKSGNFHLFWQQAAAADRRDKLTNQPGQNRIFFFKSFFIFYFCITHAALHYLLSPQFTSRWKPGDPLSPLLAHLSVKQKRSFAREGDVIHIFICSLSPPRLKSLQGSRSGLQTGAPQRAAYCGHQLRWSLIDSSEANTCWMAGGRHLREKKCATVGLWGTCQACLMSSFFICRQEKRRTSSFMCYYLTSARSLCS